VAGQLTEFAAFRLFCKRHITTESGLPLVLEPFQVEFLTDFFAGATETVAVLPKKTGKSTLMAALATFVLVSGTDREIAIVASSRDQAGLIHRQASGMVRRSPWLTERVRPTMRELRSRRDGGVIRVMAADTATADGWLGSLALIDELHRAQSIELFNIMRLGVGPLNGRVFAISTAGDSEESPLGRIRQTALKMPNLKRDGAHVHVRSDNGKFSYHEWSLPACADLTDYELVKQANPPSWTTPETLRDIAESPSTTPWYFARFCAGVWLKGENAAIRPDEWDALHRPGLEIPEGAEVNVGMDLGWRHDCTALVPVHVDDDRRLVADATILTPPADGSLLDEREIAEALIDYSKRYKLTVVYDPAAGAQQMVQQLEREHRIRFVEHSQSNTPMALAASRTMEGIRTGTIVHDGDRQLREHVLNGVAKPLSGEQFRFDRPRGTRVPTDGLIALAMAISVSTDRPKRRRTRIY
jgi:phage terminase large subunit-like protein